MTATSFLREAFRADLVGIWHVDLGGTGSYFYFGKIAGTRPAGDYTVRVVPARPGVRVPTETPLIRWQR